MRIVSAAATAVALSFVASPAGAQDVATGFDMSQSQERNSRAELSVNAVKQKEQAEFARTFGKCAYGRNPDRARLALDQMVEGKAEKTLRFGEYVARVDVCTPVRTIVDFDLMRAGIAEQSVLDPEHTTTIPQGGSVEQVNGFMKAVIVPKVDKKDPFTMHQLAGQCRVAIAPFPARAVLSTEPGSDEESAALATLKEITPSCDVLLSDVTELTPYFQRAYTALALYYWIDFAGDAG
ncbi:hypothetical protein [Paraurantiacibacter namhicola]|uniref:Uncharacterized protein n=1 Tax=Paraurantiacibacter namhicola TaxID=645517 RepID=A0A1C7D9D5_9SPHN|nr:hypothetical protein [Paraurantiacibacter namhicola]ANU08099.1 hypothetical protein A6F65_01804 [Paraurantiacibacter namhicola]